MTADLAEFEAIKRRHTPRDADALEILDAGDDDTVIPPRGWLLGNTFCRRYVSSLTSSGGSGKTTLRIAQGLALATGRALTGEHVFQRSRVLVLSLEDDLDELRRRVRAARHHHRISASDVKGWLFLSAPKGLRIADMKEGAVQVGTLDTMIRETIEKHGIDVVMLDPFVKTHNAPENDNAAIDAVATILSKIAIELDCAVDAPHHVSKGAATAGDADKGRGASSFKDAARLVYSLTTMTPEEAQTFGLTEADRRSLVRVDSAKVNIVPASAEAKWFRLVGVPLGNGTAIYPAGDEVQAIEPWSPPNLWEAIPPFVANKILDDLGAGIEGGGLYSDAPAATDRAAWPLVQRHAPSLSEAQCRKIISTWRKNGVLTPAEYRDEKSRKDRTGLRVVETKRPS